MRKYLTFLFIILTVYSCTQKQQVKNPNIILVMSDDQGWGDLSCKENSNISTPNIDNLAETGVTFDRFLLALFARQHEPSCLPVDIM
jgi:hypothetical protein